MINCFVLCKKNARLAASLVIIATVASLSSCTNPVTNDKKAATTIPAAKPQPMTVDSGKLVGAWHDESIKTDKGEQIAYEVVSSGQKVYIQAITFTGKKLKLNDTPPISPSASEIKRQGDKYVCVDRPDESYKIDKLGNLLIYDKGSLVATCTKLL
jgi:hypothetical protein